ncbi:type II toxin-antitoxin system RelE/ParE family toxin [Variovorax sp.]|jgi:phage-related protein|uniref:type II toxin-antitoxin system RelE/ParE family toxin n=1 Tax=Variovorax sp. TaxID=1871043 RepID=UPI001229A5C6|nr:type II toxin-antitoxin system RelE/ParE family toxin [Variovorax sp.]TAJ64047.1 MAG: type II toxin-antitoxin system RelE/ParE family toxin [Variovorax sp.]
MEENDEPPKPLKFVGRSLDEIKGFPSDVRQDAGFNLDLIQNGKNPSDWKPLKGVGRGVREIRLWDDSGTYRVIYVANLKDAVYVLGAFKKTTQKTENVHLDLVKTRFKQIDE